MKYVEKEGISKGDREMITLSGKFLKYNAW